MLRPLFLVLIGKPVKRNQVCDDQHLQHTKITLNYWQISCVFAQLAEERTKIYIYSNSVLMYSFEILTLHT